MLDLGFLPDVERLLARTPATRQTMLFSATMPGAIVSLARTHMRHPVNIRAESAAETQMVPATAQFIYQVHDLDKTEMLARILQAENSGSTIVFTRTKRAAQRVADDLAERGFPASPLHGDMAQVAREKALKRFRERKVRVLVATDVAARGIDVSDVTHVINYSCPEDDNTYVHRIGRTGRAGATGVGDHLRRLGGRHPLEGHQQGARTCRSRSRSRPTPRREQLLPRPRHPAGTSRAASSRPPRRRRLGRRTSGDGERSRPPRDRNRDRSRTRTRGGKPVDGDANGPTAPSGDGADGDQPGPARKRSRNRRRSRSGQSDRSQSS